MGASRLDTCSPNFSLGEREILAIFESLSDAGRNAQTVTVLYDNDGRINGLTFVGQY